MSNVCNINIKDIKVVIDASTITTHGETIEYDITINGPNNMGLNYNFNYGIGTNIKLDSNGIYKSRETYKVKKNDKSPINAICQVSWVNNKGEQEIRKCDFNTYLGNLTKVVNNKGSGPNGDFIVGDKINFTIKLQDVDPNTEYNIKDTFTDEEGNVSNMLINIITDKYGNGIASSSYTATKEGKIINKVDL